MINLHYISKVKFSKHPRPYLVKKRIRYFFATEKNPMNGIEKAQKKTRLMPSFGVVGVDGFEPPTLCL